MSYSTGFESGDGESGNNIAPPFSPIIEGILAGWGSPYYRLAAR